MATTSAGTGRRSRALADREANRSRTLARLRNLQLLPHGTPAPAPTPPALCQEHLSTGPSARTDNRLARPRHPSTRNSATGRPHPPANVNFISRPTAPARNPLLLNQRDRAPNPKRQHTTRYSSALPAPGGAATRPSLLRIRLTPSRRRARARHRRPSDDARPNGVGLRPASPLDANCTRPPRRNSSAPRVHRCSARARTKAKST